MRDLVRSRWAAVGAAVAVTLGAGGVSLTQAAISDGERPVTVTVDTTRILDTRTGLGLAGGRFVDSTPQELQVTGDVPIAPSGTATVVPAGAVGVLVNITVVAPDSKGFLSLRSGGAAGTPATSTVNFEAGITTPNAATVDLSGDGKVQIWLETDNDGGTAHVLLDIVGYTVDHNHDDRYLQGDDNKLAYLWACDQNATEDVSYDATSTCGYAFNPSGGLASVTRTAIGVYSVSFADLNMNEGHIQVTSYGSTPDLCKVGSWSSSSATVRCFDPTGAPVNEQFTILAID